MIRRGLSNLASNPISPMIHTIVPSSLQVDVGFVSTGWFAVGALALLTLTVLVFGGELSQSQKPLPPGPVPDFIIGNARQIPKKIVWLAYSNLADKFGALRNPLIFVCHYSKLKPRFLLNCNL